MVFGFNLQHLLQTRHMSHGRNLMKNIAVTHIENRRLLEAATGTVKLEDWERQHLHQCEVCQGVFCVFLRQPVSKPSLAPAAKKKKEPAA